MVNYFTLPKVLEMLQEFTIQVLGTARFCPGWPVKNIKDFDNIQINFNKIFWSVDSFGAIPYQVDGQWVCVLGSQYYTLSWMYQNVIGGGQY